jgi:hypothetical protein
VATISRVAREVSDVLQAVKHSFVMNASRLSLPLSLLLKLLKKIKQRKLRKQSKLGKLGKQSNLALSL